MPPKKSNLNNARSREARRKRVKRANQSAEQIAIRNAAQRIRTAEGRAQDSQEQCDERLQQSIAWIRAAREQNIAAARVQGRQSQQTGRTLTHASFVRLAFEYELDINYSTDSKMAVRAMDKDSESYKRDIDRPSSTTTDDRGAWTDCIKQEVEEEIFLDFEVEDTKLVRPSSHVLGYTPSSCATSQLCEEIATKLRSSELCTAPVQEPAASTHAETDPLVLSDFTEFGQAVVAKLNAMPPQDALEMMAQIQLLFQRKHLNLLAPTTGDQSA